MGSPTNLRKRILERTADEPSKVWSSLGRLRTGRRADESPLPTVGGHVAEQGTAREEGSRSDKCDCIVNREKVLRVSKAAKLFLEWDRGRVRNLEKNSHKPRRSSAAETWESRCRCRMLQVERSGL